ncbi:MAG: Dabb family protein [Ruminococcus sp.]|nr:Dabb family protein [Ruminococcus sp.]
MIRHIVMFTLLEEANGKTKKENLAEAVEKAKALKDKVPSLRNYSVVTNYEKADRTNYDIALVCDFDDMNGLDEYQNHPDHKAFGAFLKNIRDGRACIDFEI